MYFYYFEFSLFGICSLTWNKFYSLEIHFVSGLSIAASQKTIETVYQSVSETSTQNATLQCAFQADPNTTITWYKESKLLTDQSKFYIQAKANSSFLTVLGVTVNDIGNYSCNATNNQSSAVDHISLSVKGEWSIKYNRTVCIYWCMYICSLITQEPLQGPQNKRYLCNLHFSESVLSEKVFQKCCELIWLNNR